MDENVTVLQDDVRKTHVRYLDIRESNYHRLTFFDQSMASSSMPRLQHSCSMTHPNECIYGPSFVLFRFDILRASVPNLVRRLSRGSDSRVLRKRKDQQKASNHDLLLA